MNKNKNLKNAKKNKNDEFYTQLTDIEKELKHYREHFKGKIIFCNCDDPEESKFWRFFYISFKFLGLKKLISTHYHPEKATYKQEYNGVDVKRTPLKQNGDFRSPECVEILKEADIVVTNPPFSLFREYIAQLIEHDKKFIVIGNQNAITYKEIFKLLKNNQIWLGANSGTFSFEVPTHYDMKNIKTRDDGTKYAKLGNITWYTNLHILKREEEILLYENYTPEKYPKYDNYDAINVDKVAETPKDYDGAMGVPITFMSKYNPNQFKILGQTHSGDKSEETEKLRTCIKNKHRGLIEGRQKYARILIKKI